MVPASWKAEVKEVWATLDDFAEYQWKPAARLAIEGRRRRAEEEAGKVVPGTDSENPMMRFLASMATPAEEGGDGSAGGGAAGGGAASGGGNKAQAEAARIGDAAVVSGAADGAGGSGESVAGFFYGEDEATPEDLAERERRAAWSLEGGLGRIVLTSLFFTFSLANAAKGKWSAYPETTEELESLLGLEAAAAGAVAASATEP